jgi:hypothetical protein
LFFTFFACARKVTKEHSRIERHVIHIEVHLAIRHWETQTALDNLELKLSSLFGNPGRWFFAGRECLK